MTEDHISEVLRMVNEIADYAWKEGLSDGCYQSAMHDRESICELELYLRGIHMMKIDKGAKMNIYTLIAYRPNGVDTCRGCEMGKSGSEMFSMTTEDRDRVIEKLADFAFKDRYADRATCTWEILLYINGHLFHGYNDVDDVCSPDNFDELSDECRSILAEKEVVEKRRIKEHEARLKLEKQAKEENQKKLKEDREYEEFMRLKEKFKE